MANVVDSPDEGLSTPQNGLDSPSHKSPPTIMSQNSLDRAQKEKLIMRKQVSFSADPEENMIITGARDCLCLMASGSDFIKIKPGAREFQRHFYFNQDTLSIHWVPSRKKGAKIIVDDIMSVQMGQKTESFRTAVNEYPSSRCFSIILRDNTSVDLVALVPNEAYIWVKGLRCLVTGGLDEEHRNTAEELRDRWLEEIYNAADLNHDGTLEHIEFLELMESLNKHLTTLHVVKKFKESELCKAGTTLPLDKFMLFFKQIVNRPEVHVVLARYATNNDYLSAEDLQLFLQAEQGVWEASVEQCNQLIETYEPTSDGRKNSYMTVDGFSSFLMSEDNRPYHDIELDMAHPMTDYYVNTSYSSGSAGWPDVAELSKSNYITVLKSAFRCIRIEVWDGPEGPQVWHRNEETNRLSLQRVLQTINSVAFQDCELPLFINLENHCSANQQLMVAKLFKDAFGDRLFSNSATIATLTDLKHKVVIKAKSPQNDVSVSNGNSTVSVDSTENIDMCAGSTNLRKRKKKNGPSSSEDDPLDPLSFFKSYVDDKDPTCCNYAAEYPDNKIDMAIEQNSAEVIKFTKEAHMFVRPQILSKNIVSPLGQWQCGCQFVSVYNVQQDFTTMLNRSMFMQHGGRGIVLKPEILREECYHYCIENDSHIAGIHPKHLNIRLISAQQLPKPEGSVSKVDTIDPYIVVRIIGIPADSHEYRTYAVKNDGFHPVWEEEVSFTILNPDCAFLHILMLDDDFIGDDYIGQVLVPLNMVKQGFRHLPLCARDGSSLDPASVFVHIDIKDQLNIQIKRGISNAKKKPAVLPKPECLRQCGISNIDAKLKENQSIVDSICSLVIRFRSAVMDFKMSSGLDCFAHIRHCLRLLDLRLQTNESALHISEDTERGSPQIAVSGVIQVAAVQKAVAAFDHVSQAIYQLQEEGEESLDKLNSLIAQFDVYRKDLMCFVEEHAGKKRIKALQNYSFNLWLLKEHRKMYEDTLQDKERFSQHVYAHTGYKVKRGSWMLRKTGSSNSTSSKLMSITENSSDNNSDDAENNGEEVFDQGDGILRPSTKEPKKSALKRSTTPPIDYHELLRQTNLECGDI